MIELRWLEVDGGEGPYVRVGGPRTYKLQWRASMRAVMDRDDPPCGRIVWTDWVDVPVTALPAPPRAIPLNDEVRSLS